MDPLPQKNALTHKKNLGTQIKNLPLAKIVEQTEPKQTNKNT